MKKEKLQIGGLYACRIENDVVPVRIDEACDKGGWLVTPVAGGRQEHVLQAAQFRKPWTAPEDPGAEPTEEGEFEMKKADVTIGQTYTAKVSGTIVRVRIDSENRHGGWDATNLETNKRVRIKTAQRLRHSVGEKKAKDRPPPLSVEEKPKRKRAAAAAGEAPPKRVSALDAAAQVLKTSGQAMRTTEMVLAMAEQGLWSSPNGKTPAATLYAAILREIGTKGEGARFKKVDAGKFEYAGA